MSLTIIILQLKLPEIKNLKSLFFYFIFLFISCLNLSAQNKSEIARAKAELLFGVDNLKAMELYKLAYKLAEKDNNIIQMTNLCVDISSVYHQNSDFDNALIYCRKGFQLLNRTRVRPDSLLFKLNSSTGTMFKNLFQLDSTILFYERANSIISSKPNLEKEIPEYVLHHYNSYGKWLISFGNYKSGLIFLEKAKMIANKYSYFEDLDIINTNMGNLYERLGEFHKAEKYFHQSVLNQKKSSILRCYALIGEGWVKINSNQIKAGIDLIKNALKDYNVLISNDSGLRSVDFATIAEYNLGVGYQKLGDLKKSKEIFNYLIIDLEKDNLKNTELKVKTWMRISELNSKDPYLALTAISKSIESNTKEASSGVLNEKLQFEALFRKAKYEYQIFLINNQDKYLSSALLSIENASKSIKKLRENFYDEETKLFLNNQLKPFHQFAIGIYVNAHSKRSSKSTNLQLFNLIENYKSSVLSELLATQKAKNSIIPENLLQKEQYLNIQISKIRNNGELTNSKLSKLTNLEAQRYFLEKNFEQMYPNYIRQKKENSVLEINEIQKKLNDDEAYLSYFLQDNYLLMFLVLKYSYKIKVLKINAKEFSIKKEDFKKILYTNPGFNKYNGTLLSSYFYFLLYSPFKKDIESKTRLIINRDVELNFMPFEVLESGEFLNDFLFAKHSISYVYSNNITRDYEIKKHKISVLGVAPFVKVDQIINNKFTILPESRSQINEISDDRLIGRNATKRNFISKIEKSPIIYFATHSVLNDNNPDASYIAFYPNEDYLLKAEEINKLDLSQTQLVVLTSCEAGTGKTHLSEGMLSISRAFQRAGCPAVVTSMWASNDASMTLLSTTFHKYLRQGYNKDIALQKAKIEFINSSDGKKYNHPYFWANLILVGNRSAVFLKNNQIIYAIIFLVLAMELCYLLNFGLVSKGFLKFIKI